MPAFASGPTTSGPAPFPGKLYRQPEPIHRARGGRSALGWLPDRNRSLTPAGRGRRGRERCRYGKGRRAAHWSDQGDIGDKTARTGARIARTVARKYSPRSGCSSRKPCLSRVGNGFRSLANDIAFTSLRADGEQLAGKAAFQRRFRRRSGPEDVVQGVQGALAVPLQPGLSQPQPGSRRTLGSVRLALKNLLWGCLDHHRLRSNLRICKKNPFSYGSLRSSYVEGRGSNPLPS